MGARRFPAPVLDPAAVLGRRGGRLGDTRQTRDGKAVILAAGKKITIPADALADALIAEGICAEVTPDLAEGYAGMLTPKPA